MNDRDSKHETPFSIPREAIGRKLAIAGLGLFLFWIGVSSLLDLGWGVGLVGTAAIILVTQAARRFFGRSLERFWVAVGVLFLVIGTWELIRIPVDLVPVLLIVVGGALLLSVLTRRKLVGTGSTSKRWCGWCRSRRRGASVAGAMRRPSAERST